jgi:hypothetical protein
MKEKTISQTYTYIGIGVILGILISLLFALILGIIGVIILSILCICVLLLYVMNQVSNDQITLKKPVKGNKKEQEWFSK